MTNRLKFLGAMVKARADGIFDDLIKLAIQKFPDDASDAQIAVFEGKLDQFGLKISHLETQLTQEKAEYTNAKRAYDETIAAAELIGKDIESNPNDPARAEKEAGMLDLIAQAEAMRPDVEAEKADVDDVVSMIADLTSAHKELAKKIVNARENLQRAKRGMDRANRAEERSKERSETAAMAAGIRKSTQTLDIALNAMNQISTEAQERARAADLKTSSLNGARPTSNPHVADALAKAKGSVPLSQKSAADRLAALKAGAPAA